MIRKRSRRVIAGRKLGDAPIVMGERPEPATVVEHRILFGGVEGIAAAVQQTVKLAEAASWSRCGVRISPP